MSANSFETRTVYEAFRTLLTTLTPQQIAQFTDNLHGSQLQERPTSPMTPQSSSVSETSRETEVDVSSVQVQKATRAKARQVSSQMKLRKRPTNSFMAFRAYYSPIFRGLTQKEKSGLIRQLWAAEPRKHFFVLLAKAHSEVRDDHKENISFERYLAVAVGLLPIVPAKSYLAVMGWERCTGRDGVVFLTRSSATTAQDYAMTTNVSVRDIVEHCYKVGLVSRPPTPLRHSRGHVPSMEMSLGMPFAAAPMPAPSHPGQVEAAASTINRSLDPTIQALIDTPATPEPNSMPVFDFNDLRTDYHPTMETVSADQQQHYVMHPFSVHFHPDAPTVLGWDPAMIQDDFDPFTFDLADFVNFDI